MQKKGILVMIAFLMCCICSKADIQYKGILSSNYTTSKPYIFVVARHGGGAFFYRRQKLRCSKKFFNFACKNPAP